MSHSHILEKFRLWILDTSKPNLIFELWKYNLLLPIFKYDSDQKIFRCEGHRFRQIVCVPFFFLFRVFTVIWGAFYDSHFDSMVYYVVSAIIFLTALPIMIIYKNVKFIEQLQLDMKKLREKCESKGFRSAEKIKFFKSVTQLVLFFFMIFYDSMSLLLYARFGMFVNSITCLLCLFALANLQLFFACTLDDFKYHFKNLYSPSQEYNSGYETTMNRTKELNKMMVTFFNIFSVSISMNLLMEFSILLVAPYWMVFTPKVDSVFHTLRFCVPYIWWLNSSYWLVIEVMATSNAKKEVSNSLNSSLRN